MDPFLLKPKFSVRPFSTNTRTRLSLENKKIISNNLESNSNFIEFIIGHLLGDGNLTLNGNEAYFRLNLKDQTYLQYVWDYFNNLGIVGVSVKEYTYLDNRTKKNYTSYRLATFSLPIFTKLYYEWYKKENNVNIKIVPLDLYSKFSPIVLTNWISGDGSYNEREKIIMLCTDSFSLEEVNFLRDILYKKYGINSTMNSLGGQLSDHHRIRIPKESSIIVKNLVQEHIHAKMKYRVGL